MKISIINSSEVSRLSVAIHDVVMKLDLHIHEGTGYSVEYNPKLNIAKRHALAVLHNI
ncbi:hypothetical protein OZH87_22705 [Escherichia coli]|nr:hypothetical protein [Escherichia coli]